MSPARTGGRQRAGRVVRGWMRRLWAALRPWDPTRSIKAALQALVIASVMITTLLVTVAIHSATEIRVITIFSIIASLLITQIVATNLTAPLREMTIASTIPEMLRGIRAVGSDLRWFTGVGTPSILIGEMTLAGV